MEKTPRKSYKRRERSSFPGFVRFTRCDISDDHSKVTSHHFQVESNKRAVSKLHLTELLPEHFNHFVNRAHPASQFFNAYRGLSKEIEHVRFQKCSFDEESFFHFISKLKDNRAASRALQFTLTFENCQFDPSWLLKIFSSENQFDLVVIYAEQLTLALLDKFIANDKLIACTGSIQLSGDFSQISRQTLNRLTELGIAILANPAQVSVGKSPLNAMSDVHAVQMATASTLTSGARVDQRKYYKHQVFISHRGSMKLPVAFPLMAIFTYFCGPKFAFFDQISFQEGAGSEEGVDVGIAASKHCIAVISKDFFHSKWTLKEVEAFLNRKKHDESTKVIPLFLDISPGDCENLKPELCQDKKDSDKGSKTNSKVVKARQVLAKRLCIQGYKRNQDKNETTKEFLLKVVFHLLKDVFEDGLLSEFKKSGVDANELAWIYEESVKFFRSQKEVVNLTGLNEFIGTLKPLGSLNFRPGVTKTAKQAPKESHAAIAANLAAASEEREAVTKVIGVSKSAVLDGGVEQEIVAEHRHVELPSGASVADQARATALLGAMSQITAVSSGMGVSLPEPGVHASGCPKQQVTRVRHQATIAGQCAVDQEAPEQAVNSSEINFNC